MKKIIMPLLVVFFFTACGQKEKQQPQQEPADSLAVHSDSVHIAKDENAPQWFYQLPDEEGYIYAAAEGSSRRAGLAESKALVRARAQLADKLSALKAQKSAPAGADSADADSGIKNVFLQKTIIKQKKQIKVGNQWFVYILMEMPLNSN